MKTIDDILKTCLDDTRAIANRKSAYSADNSYADVFDDTRQQISEMVKEIIGEGYDGVQESHGGKSAVINKQRLLSRAKERGIEI